MIKLKEKKGFSLLESLFYISAFIVILGIVINGTFLMLNVYSSIKISENINKTAIDILERMTKEIRGAKSINTERSVFNSDDGVLSLNLNEDLVSPSKIEFFLENGILKFNKDFSSTSFNLSSNNVFVKKMNFKVVDSGISKLIKIELEIESQYKEKIKDETFYDSIVMRGSY